MTIRYNQPAPSPTRPRYRSFTHSLTHLRTSLELIRWRSSEAHGRPDVFIVIQFGVAAPVAPPSRQRSFPATRIDLPLVLDHLAGVTPLADQALSVEGRAFFNIWRPGFRLFRDEKSSHEDQTEPASTFLI